MVLESWCYTRKGFLRYSRRIAAQFQGIPSGVTQIPQKAAEEVLEAGIGVVLEAWCYTRADGPEVVHVAATGFQGIPELCGSVQIPQTMATARSIPTAARGVDTNRAPSSIPG